ncbi:M15 family metallopeptidase [Chitinophaga tropicalis]|uniref:M15 family metallopeptidase n=1 Tax=Chitinophaga tropicalis TaxID=2683588 RepID=UPI0012FACB65|nr:M15 family metallopeptidase [Chitinophaga tropicalis]
MKISHRFILFFLFWVLATIGRTASAQVIPLNKYGLPVVNSVSLYRQLAIADSNQLLVDVSGYIPGIRKEVRYATSNNFTHRQLYASNAVYLRLAAARALKAVQQELNKKGLGLLIFDGYRPYTVTEKMWEIVPDDRYAADPRNGSGHNRGVAVDLTIVDLHTGKPVRMPTDFDDFTEKAHHDYPLSDSTVTANRRLLRNVMEQQGFVPLATEWWHYVLKDAKKYPLTDIRFEELK